MTSTTSFNDDRELVSSIPAQIIDVPRSMLGTVDVDGSRNIVSFLEKPQRLQSGSFGTTDTMASFATIDLPGVMLSNVKNFQKLSGVFMLRADMEFRLEINAAKFQQGRYMLCWLPNGGAPNNTIAAGNWYRMHNANLVHATQLPHVEIDLATQSSVVLRVPFTSIYTHVFTNTTATNPGLGKLFIRPYSALQPGSGDNACGYTIWGSFCNIELSGSTVSQSGFTVKRKGKSVEQQEQANANIGPISGPLSVISKASGILGTIPLLSSVMLPVSWATNILSNTAAAFGFSKPINLEPAHRMIKHIYPSLANADAAFQGFNISPLSTNTVGLTSAAARTDIDEMSIDFIKQQFAYYSTFVWTDVRATGDQLINYGHSPYDKYISASTYYSFTPVGMLSRQFEFWRGSMKFRFKFVKTEFHSGRLVVAYVPYGQRWYGGLITNLDATDFLQREIIDIRDTSEFEICVPYLSPEPYSYSNNTPIGYLLLYVLDPLVCPNTVTSSINCLVEVAGGDDFEVAVPVAEQLEPVIPLSVQSGFKNIGCKDLGMAKDSLDPAIYCIGEKITSVRQILKKFNVQVPYTLAAPAPWPIPASTNNTLSILPYLNPIPTQTAALLARGVFRTDPLSFWGCMYAIQNGSVRLILSAQNTLDTTNSLVYVSHRVVSSFSSKTNYVYTDNSTERLTGNSTVQPFNLSLDGSIQVQTPVYNRTLGRTTQSALISSDVLFPTPTLTDGSNLLTVDVYTRGLPTGGQTNTYTWSRIASDDYNLSRWVGTVPVILYSATS
jgi:hypothetical protein